MPPSVVPASKPARKYVGFERRVTVRHPTNHTGVFHPIHPGQATTCRAVILDMSTGGLNLSTSRPFEAGELLSIELGNVSESLRQKLFVRVLHVKAQPGVGWSLGCKFLKPLTGAELQALV